MKSPFGARCTPRSCAHALASARLLFSLHRWQKPPSERSEPFASGSALARCICTHQDSPHADTCVCKSYPQRASPAPPTYTELVCVAEISHFMWISSLFPWRDQSWQLILLSFNECRHSTFLARIYPPPDAFLGLHSFWDAFVCFQLATGGNPIWSNLSMLKTWIFQI